MREGDAHTIELFWDQAWSFVGWYVKLQAPLRVHGTFFDTTDWALDVVVDPDGTRAWKDEDDFAQAIELGVFDEAGAAAVRAEASEWSHGGRGRRGGRTGVHRQTGRRCRCRRAGTWSEDHSPLIGAPAAGPQVSVSASATAKSCQLPGTPLSS
jgi:hypothetical protein